MDILETSCVIKTSMAMTIKGFFFKLLTAAVLQHPVSEYFISDNWQYWKNCTKLLCRFQSLKRHLSLYIWCLEQTSFCWKADYELSKGLSLRHSIKALQTHHGYWWNSCLVLNEMLYFSLMQVMHFAKSDKIKKIIRKSWKRECI